MNAVVDTLIDAATSSLEFDAASGIKRYPPVEHGGEGAFPLFVVTRRTGGYTKHTTDGQIHLARAEVRCSILLKTSAAEDADADRDAFGELERVRNAFLDALWDEAGPPSGAHFALVSDDHYRADALFSGTDCVVCDLVLTCDTEIDLT